MQPDLAARLGPDYPARLAAYRDRDYPLVIISDDGAACSVGCAPWWALSVSA